MNFYHFDIREYELIHLIDVVPLKKYHVSQDYLYHIFSHRMHHHYLQLDIIKLQKSTFYTKNTQLILKSLSQLNISDLINNQLNPLILAKSQARLHDHSSDRRRTDARTPPSDHRDP